MTYHFNESFDHNGSGYHDPIGIFLTERSRMPAPTKKECDSLLVQMKEGSTDARNELIERHLRLVASIAIKYRNANFSMEDLMAEGIQGLVAAIDKFDPTKGSKLSTYAAWWIRQRIQKALSKFTCPISVPHDVREAKRRQMRSLEKQRPESITQHANQHLQNNECANENLQERIKMVPTAIHSLDEPIGDTTRTYAEVLNSPDDGQSTYRENGSLKEDLMIAMSFLAGREKKVIKLRFGVGIATPLKLSDIAKRLKISAERVRQLEAIGLRKLRAIIMQGEELDFRRLDHLKSRNFRGKTKMSPLQLALL